MNEPARILVGTSGWSYDHWRSVFYPEHLAAGQRLPYYTQHFSTVEINATFYRLPGEAAVKRWRDEVPDGFVFAVKGSRFITHFRHLEHAEDATETFMERVSLLGDRLGVVLWQLPPAMSADPAVLDAFLGGLPAQPPVRCAVEFRNESWLAEETFDVLRAHGAAHVSVSSDVMPENLTVTADFVYLRFHGTAAYHGAYAKPALEPWAEFLSEQHRLGRDIYAYFNNDAQGHAPKDAKRLLALLGEPSGVEEASRA